MRIFDSRLQRRDWLRLSAAGMLSGVNVEATARLAASIHTPVIASGGIRDLDDINRLLKVTNSGVFAAITGRAIYEGTLHFGEANKLAAARAEPY